MAASANEGEDEIVGINVTPLVDIVLVLLLIFMVTANTIVRETVEVDLPIAAKKADATAPLLMLTMNEDAKVFLDRVDPRKRTARQRPLEARFHEARTEARAGDNDVLTRRPLIVAPGSIHPHQVGVPVTCPSSTSGPLA